MDIRYEKSVEGKTADAGSQSQGEETGSVPANRYLKAKSRGLAAMAREICQCPFTGTPI